MTVDSIANQILRRREGLIQELLAGPQGKELVRLDAAFEALTGRRPPPLSEVLGGLVDADRDTESAEAIERPEQLPVPVKTATRELLTTTRRIWTYDAMLEYFEEKGVRFTAKNLRDALRTAVLQLVEEGLVERIGRGAYRGLHSDSAPDDSAIEADPAEEVDTENERLAFREHGGPA